MYEEKFQQDWKQKWHTFASESLPNLKTWGQANYGITDLNADK